MKYIEWLQQQIDLNEINANTAKSHGEMSYYGAKAVAFYEAKMEYDKPHKPHLWKLVLGVIFLGIAGYVLSWINLLVR